MMRQLSPDWSQAEQATQEQHRTQPRLACYRLERFYAAESVEKSNAYPIIMPQAISTAKTLTMIQNVKREVGKWLI